MIHTFRKLLPGLGLLLSNVVGTAVEAQTPGSADSAIRRSTVNSQEIVPGPFLRIPQEKSITTSSTVKGTTLYQTPVPNITNALYGRLPGLFVNQGSGEPGYDGASLAIRGVGTYDNAGLTLVVDGFQTNPSFFAYLSPAEIESITVLKDPLTLATFGMKGANGVLWVVTKRGQVSKPTIQAQVVTGWQTPLTIYKPLRSFDYARLYNQAISNDNYATNGYQFNWTPAYTDAQLQAYRNGTGTDVDWYNEILKNNGRYTNTNMVFSGGDTNTKYALVLDYMNQGGMYNVPSNDRTSNAQIQRYNIRSNLDFKFFKIFEARVDLGGRIEDRRYPNYNGPALWNNLANYPANIYPVRDNISGNWSGTALFPNNPAAAVNALGWTSTHDRTMQANFSLKERLDFITPGLYLNEAVSFNTWARTNSSKTATYARFFNGIRTTTDVASDLVANANSPSNQYDWKQTNITLGYDRAFGRHAVSGAINYFGSDYTVDFNNHPAGGQNRDINIFYHFHNFGSRFNYTYNDRYVAELGFGWSGSDSYAANNRWGFYPALALGWLVSNENFLKNNRTINFLKLRASAGQSAMDQSNQGRYLYQQYYVGNGNYITGNTSLNTNGTIIPSYAANPNIFAEKSTKYNVGFDAQLFNNLSLSVDFFQDNRTGIVTVDQKLSGLIGVALPYSNIGEVVNRGYEVSASYTAKVGAVNLNAGGWVTYARNRINEQAEIPTANAFNRTTGSAIGTPIGLISEGFYDITDFNTNGTLRAGLPVPAFGAVQPGDIRYKDLDGNGRVDQNDVTQIGNPRYPNLTYAFNMGAGWKGFDFTALFQGSAGQSINLLTAAGPQTIAFVNNTNVFPIANNAWAYYPSQGIDTRATATYPRLTTRANDNNYRSSTFWMKKGDFLRLRNVELGYTLPAAIAGKVRLQQLRVYVSAVNLFSWSSFQSDYHLDPETVSGYPGLKSFNTGITLTF